MKKVYIETVGCQMNVHDSEKVAGTLLTQGYAQVPTPEEAELVFYNTCSIRDKAEQKVFNRLNQFKKDGQGKTFAVLGCVAQQEGDKIFERAPPVSRGGGEASTVEGGEGNGRGKRRGDEGKGYPWKVTTKGQHKRRGAEALSAKRSAKMSAISG